MYVLMTVIDTVRHRATQYYGDVSDEQAKFLAEYDGRSLQDGKLSVRHMHYDVTPDCSKEWPDEWGGLTRLHENTGEPVHLYYDKLITFFYDY